MTVQIRDRQYVTVAERLAEAHQGDKDFEMIESVPIQVGADGWIWRCVITLGGVSSSVMLKSIWTQNLERLMLLTVGQSLKLQHVGGRWRSLASPARAALHRMMR